jgi:integrase
MKPEIAIYPQKNSPFLRVAFLAWDARRSQWRRVFKSTKTSNQEEAMMIGRALATAAAQAAPDSSGRQSVSRDSILKTVNAVLELAGIEKVVPTLGWKTFADSWLEAKRRAGHLSQSSLDSYASRLKAFTEFLPDPDTALNSITVQHLRQWQKEMIDGGRTAVTVNKITNTVGTLFKQAVAEGYMTRQAMGLVERMATAPQEREAFSLDEIRILLTHLKKANKQDWLTAVLLGVCTGQRLTDCTRALWTHINTSASPWWIWTLQQQKTGTRVEIPLVEPLATHLRSMATGDSLFLSPSLAEHYSGGDNGLSAQFRQLLKDAGIEGDKIEKKGKGRSWNSKTFHSLRHTCNSLMANAGVSQDVRRAILGHASDAMNTRYTHLEISTSGDALSHAIGSVLSTPKAGPPASGLSRQTSRTSSSRRAGTR